MGGPPKLRRVAGWLGIALGFVAVFFVTGALVELRYRWADPADVAASGGMYAGGDMLACLFLGGGLSLVGEPLRAAIERHTHGQLMAALPRRNQQGRFGSYQVRL